MSKSAQQRVSVLRLDGESGTTGGPTASLDGDEFAVESVSSAGAALDRLADGAFDCVVSSYELPDTTGLELLETVRTTHPGLAFVLVTSEGSEAIAARAISKGVSEYVQRVPDTDQSDQLRERVLAAVDGHPPARDQTHPASRFDRLPFDMIERKERERELLRERAFVSQALDALSDVFYVVGTNGSLQRWNQRFLDVTGYSAAQLEEMRAVDLFPDDQRELVEAGIADTIETGSTTVEAEFLTCDGDRLSYEFTGSRLQDLEGNVMGLVGVGRDISDRKAQLRELHTFQQAVENAGHAIYWLDADGRIEYVNPAFEAQTGYSGAAAIGQRPSLLTADSESLDQMWETVRTGETWEAELTNRRRTGERYIVNQIVSPVIEDDEISRFVAVAADITARHHREQQLSVLQRVLRHDLRNNLNEILLSVQLLDRELTGESHDHHVAAVLETVEETLSLTRDIKEVRDVFQIDGETQTQQLDLAARTRAQLATIRAERPGVDFTVDLPATAPVVANELLGRAIRNVVQNAIQHNDRATPAVDVALRRHPETGDIALRIADNGPGIPNEEITVLDSDGEDQLHHLSGFGLWLVNWVLSLSGGHLTFESNDPRGTVVELVLPAAPTAGTPEC